MENALDCAASKETAYGTLRIGPSGSFMYEWMPVLQPVSAAASEMSVTPVDAAYAFAGVIAPDLAVFIG